jgi:hypothetical protein
MTIYRLFNMISTSQNLWHNYNTSNEKDFKSTYTYWWG